MRLHAITIISAMAAMGLTAAEPVAPTISNINLQRDGDVMEASFSIDTKGLGVKSGEAVIIEPMIVAGVDTLKLTPVGLYGRRRWIHAERQDNLATTSVKTWQTEDPFVYESTTAWGDWMDGALLVVKSHTEGCCNTPADESSEELAQHFEPIVYTPEIIYAEAPKVDASILRKTRELSGRANVEFVVNKTDIRPDYRNNHAELAKIRASIDSVRTDRDLTITGIWLKGFASPESPYSHNSDLARGRVAAVKEYVRDLYNFPSELLSTDYEPEDWAGLREYVESSNLDNRQGILDYIDSDMEPDAKEAAIKRAYPQDYKHLLTHSYPALRHTDYRIEYFIREFTDPEEIRRLAMENPGKLSANEFHIAAQTLEPGSEEFIQLYRTAARMYPDDPTANLNAAAAAMAGGDNHLAMGYLKKAGNSVEADYLRGVMAMESGDRGLAEQYFRPAAAAGIGAAVRAMEVIERMKERERRQSPK